MINWEAYIPDAKTLPVIFAMVIFAVKLNPILRALREACSEPEKDNKRGKVSRKRIIPLMFASVSCYMIIDNINTCGGKAFNFDAFIVLILYIILDTGLVTVAQADGLLDRLTTLKTSAVKREQTTTQTQKVTLEQKTEETSAQGSVATEV